MKKPQLLLGGLCLATTLAAGNPGAPDLSKEKTLYLIPYSHLDTQWQWDYPTTIDTYLKRTLDEGFALLDKYPEYLFNFTGSRRYAMMKEYYPERYERMKKYIAEGRWIVNGSTVDEMDVVNSGPESYLRHFLYGADFARREFGVEALDFSLPDCFGFPATLPTLVAHAGLKGFTTQKLSWQAANPIPFNFGIWRGPDGSEIYAGLNCMDYTGKVPENFDIDPEFTDRINRAGKSTGLYADMRYYGVGDRGGAPREGDFLNALEASKRHRNFNIRLCAMDQLFRDMEHQKGYSLPTYEGDLLLVEHSAGTLTSQAYMKRWNRKNERLLQAAERAASLAAMLGTSDYPAERLHKAWDLLLGSQMHDMIPGSSISKVYEYSHNDEVLVMNLASSVLTNAVGAVSRSLDTKTEGIPVIVYNPVERPRQDIAEATVEFAQAPAAVRVTSPEGKEVPAQIIGTDGRRTKLIFLADMPASGYAVYSVTPAEKPATAPLRVTDNTLENDRYKVMIDRNGDVCSVYDKRARRELLREAARWELCYEHPLRFPSWNMEWADRQLPVKEYVSGPARVRIVENGPVRVAIEVERTLRGNMFRQVISLAAGEPGNTVRYDNTVKWQMRGRSLRASFPLTVSAPKATYNWESATVQRDNNRSHKFESPSHEWFDLTDRSGSYGVSVLEDCKNGSDKPNDSTLRLTLLYTPHANREYYGVWQDWGEHAFSYALYGHEGSWQKAGSDRRGRFFNEPLLTFLPGEKHAGLLGRSVSAASVDKSNVKMLAMKRAEHADGYYIVRFNEHYGNTLTDDVQARFCRKIADAYETDGQERWTGPADFTPDGLRFTMGRYGIRTFAVRFEAPETVPSVRCTPVELPFDTDAVSLNTDRSDGEMAQGSSFAGELFPETLTVDDIVFRLGDTAPGAHNAVSLRGQRIALPAGDYDRLYLLMSADRDTEGVKIKVDGRSFPIDVQSWQGYIGQWERRLTDNTLSDVLYGIETGYIKRDPVALLGTHRHTPEGDLSYRYSYIYKYSIPVSGASTLELPSAPGVKLFAVTAAGGTNDRVVPAMDLYDNFDDREPFELLYPTSYVREGTEEFGKSCHYLGSKGWTGLNRQKNGTLKDQPARLDATASDDDPATKSNRTVRYYCLPFGPEASPSGSTQPVECPAMTDGKLGPDKNRTARYYEEGEGRYLLDLGRTVTLKGITTTSFIATKSGPVRYTVWVSTRSGAKATAADPAAEGWTYVTTVSPRGISPMNAQVSVVEVPQGVKARKVLLISLGAHSPEAFDEIDLFTE